MADIFKPTHIPSMGFPSPTSAKARAKKRSSSAELGLLTTSSLNSHNLSLCGFSPILTKLQERNWALQPLKDLRGQHDGFFFATWTDSIQRHLNPNAIYQMKRVEKPHKRLTLRVPEADPPPHSAIVFEIPIQRAAMCSAMAQKFIERLSRWQRKA